MTTKRVVNRVLWGVWQVDQPRPVAHGAGNHRETPTES